MSRLDPSREEIDAARRVIDEWSATHAAHNVNVYAYVLGVVQSELTAASEAAEVDALDGGTRRDPSVRSARAWIAAMAERGAA